MDSITHLAALRVKVAETREAFERAASASFLHDDPAKDQLLAMGLAMDAMLQICEVNDTCQRAVTADLEAKIGEIVGKATDKLVERAGPHVADAIERSTQFHLKTARGRTLLGGAAAILIGVALFAGFFYSEGFACGRAQGEASANTISAAMAAGPGVASAWSLLMANNDPVLALASCQKLVSVANDGRHYCSMPVWLDRRMVPH
jgi:hypothetical protein